MSLTLVESSKNDKNRGEKIDCSIMPPYREIRIGDYFITFKDFQELVYYYLDNFNFLEKDFRHDLVRKIKNIKITHGWGNKGYRYTFFSEKDATEEYTAEDLLRKMSEQLKDYFNCKDKNDKRTGTKSNNQENTSLDDVLADLGIEYRVWNFNLEEFLQVGDNYDTITGIDPIKFYLEGQNVSKPDKYIGYKDKNGNKIFVNDIVLIEGVTVYRVKQNDRGLFTLNTHVIQTTWDSSLLEVVGNIYE